MITGRPLETGRMGNSTNQLRSVGPLEADAFSRPGADVPHGATAERAKDRRSFSQWTLA
jgi:hypothetical protein